MRISDWSSDVCSSDLDVDHRLDREDHAGLQFGAGAGAAGMDDLGRVVEQAADAVAAEIAHHAVTMRLGMLLDGMADVAEVIAGLRLIDADHQAFVGDVEDRKSVV